MPAAVAKKKGPEQVKVNERKWGKPLVQAGWSLFPNTILEYQNELGLNATDVNIILQLLMHWWEAERLPRPSKATIAKRMGVDSSTIQRRIRKMEKSGLIRRIQRHGSDHRQTANEYDLSGLISAATPFAKKIIAERAQKEEQGTRRRRLKVFDGNKPR